MISCNFRAISRGPRGLATPSLRNLPLPARNFTRGFVESHLRLGPFDEPRFAAGVFRCLRMQSGDASRTGLLDFDLRPGSFYLLLGIFGLLFGHAFLHCFRRAFDKSFRFRQA